MFSWFTNSTSCPSNETKEREFQQLQEEWNRLRGPPTNHAPRVVVIGAGPVGLVFTANLLRKHPSAITYLIDRRAPKYSREQIFALEPSTIRLLPPEAKSKMFDQKNSPGVYTLQPGYDRFAKGFSCQAPVEAGPERRFGSITIKKFEEIMYNYLKDTYGDNGNLRLFPGTTVTDINERTLRISFSGEKESFLDANQFDYIIATSGYGKYDQVVDKFLGGRKLLFK
jgi:2-polyprenyl-6-methoxyphenol hydroxylase-like FAD-dependent oxidoreductase